MQNIVYILPTRFIDETTGIQTIGYKIFDNVSQTYDNTWPKMLSDPTEILQFVLQNADEQTMEIIGKLCDNQEKLVIGKTILTYEEYSVIIQNTDF